MRHLSLALFLPLVFLAGCAGLSGQSAIDTLNDADVSGEGFSPALARAYRDMANNEWGRMYDYRSGLHFARKGQAAAQGEAVFPDEPDSRNIPAVFAADVASGYDRLSAALAAGAGARHPEAAAQAQTQFDCWLEQLEENHQAGEITACRSGFEDALSRIDAARYMVFFEAGSRRLNGTAQHTLAAAVARAHALNIRNFAVVGYTDTRGDIAANQALGRARAAAVAAALRRLGVPAAAIGRISRGEADPLVASGPDMSQPENRRVEVIAFK